MGKRPVRSDGAGSGDAEAGDFETELSVMDAGGGRVLRALHS